MKSICQKFRSLSFCSWGSSIAAVLLIPLVVTFTTEWIARSSSWEVTWRGMFSKHFMAFVLSYLVLVMLYVALTNLTGRHWVGTLLTGSLSIIMGIVTYYKMQFRGEPLLPWDLMQIGALAGISDKIELHLQVSIVAAVLVLLALTLLATRIHLPVPKIKRTTLLLRGGTVVCCIGILFYTVTGIYLNEERLQKMQIWKISWKTAYELNDYGVVSTFLQNLQSLVIQQPEPYDQKTVESTMEVVESRRKERYLLTESGAPLLGESTVQQPDIIFYMSEGFWDIRRLEGITYSEELFPNLTSLQKEGVYGYALSPSYGGNTCNAEFEALTGYSMKFLPNGSIPYISYVAEGTPAVPAFLKERGYETLALHTYQRPFWNRDVAYAAMGIDQYYAEESFEDPEMSRGYISDMELARRMESELLARQTGEQPLFLHVVSVQNHTSYDPANFSAEELIGVSTQLDISEESLGKLQDCATGLQQADAALGYLTDYLRTTDRPTILVFWGDHLNPVGVGTELQDKTGYSAQDAGASMRETPFLIWSNYDSHSEDLGVVSIYNLAPVMMDLYGLEKPLYFDFLLQQYQLSRGSAAGFLSDEKGECIPLDMAGEEQRQEMKVHQLLQYDLLHGRRYSLEG